MIIYIGTVDTEQYQNDLEGTSSMYGYLRLDNKTAPVEIRRYYRQEYCSLCHALWNFYGYKPRFLLSYDVTFMAALLDLDTQITFTENKPICYFKRPIESDNEKWKKLSAILILLSAEKLRDNINDDESIIARIILMVFHKSIKRAERDYPELSGYLKSAFRKMSDIEKSKGDVYDLAAAFADIMVKSKRLLYGESDLEDAVLKHVSSWIYFIDAIDDIDKDAKSGSYNPLLMIAKSREDLIINHADYIADFIIKQHDELIQHLNKLDINTNRGMTIINILNYSIPKVTRRILMGKKGFAMEHPYVKYFEGKGGIIFA